MNLFGQGMISGRIIDNETKEPLVGATVLFRLSRHGTITNANGHFQFPEANPGDTLEVTFIGYDKRLIANPTADDVIALSPSGLKMTGTFPQDSSCQMREAILSFAPTTTGLPCCGKRI
jgi:hypothetical protein